MFVVSRGGVAGPAGQALAGPLFSGSFRRLVSRLQRQSEDKTIRPGVPRRLAFPLRARVSRIIVPALLRDSLCSPTLRTEGT